MGLYFVHDVGEREGEKLEIETWENSHIYIIFLLNIVHPLLQF